MNYMGIGVDPGGTSGCICTKLFADGEEQYDYLRFKNATLKDIYRFLRKSKKMASVKGCKIFCVLEKVHSMPGQGVSSSFKFGVNYGNLQGLILALGIPFEEISPAKWTKDMGKQKRPGEDKTASKKRRRTEAEALYPQIKFVNDTVDAHWLAIYAERLITK